MQKDTEKTKVIFRMEKYAIGEWYPLAVFPAMAGTSDPYTCTCYSIPEQHNAMSLGFYREFTRPAKPSEFKALQEHLEFLGYNLQIVKRFTRKDLESRKAQVQR